METRNVRPVVPNDLNITTGKQLTVTNSLTLSGTDGTTMTFPSTSATIARTDAAQTFTGNQAITGTLSATDAIKSGTTGTVGKLQLARSTDGAFVNEIRNAGSGAAPDLEIYSGVAGNIIAYIAGTECWRTDASRNFGLDVTPAAWTSGYRSLQVLNTGIFGTASLDMNLHSNTYVDAIGYKRIAAGHATRYTQYLGAHEWHVAANSTAGSAITFTQAMTLNNSGRLLIGTTTDNGVDLLQVAGSIAVASGISFPATQVVSADANTLDDYEKGTFTPVITGTGTAGVGTYGTQTGTYTKIGNRVTGELYLNWSAHTGAGDMNVTGMPFTSAANVFTPCGEYDSNIALTAGNVIKAYVTQNSTTISLVQVPSGGGAAVAIPLDTSGEIMLSFSYRV